MNTKKMMWGFLGSIAGAIVGIPGSYLFQSAHVRSYGGFGGYLENLPTVLDSIGGQDILGLGDNALNGIIVFAALGAIAGVYVGSQKTQTSLSALPAKTTEPH